MICASSACARALPATRSRTVSVGIVGMDGLNFVMTFI